MSIKLCSCCKVDEYSDYLPDSDSNGGSGYCTACFLSNNEAVISNVFSGITIV